MRGIYRFAAIACVVTAGMAAAGSANAQGEVPCRKGILWPFSREPGDCLTDVEKRNGQTGVYGNANAVVAAPAPAQPQPNDSLSRLWSSFGTAPAAAPQVAAPVTAPVVTVENCSKGFLWPFSRETGDCLTDTEIRNGQTGVYGNPATVPGAQVVNLAPATSSGGMFGLFGSNPNSNRGLLEDAYAPVVTAAPPPANTFQANAAQVNAAQMNSGQSNAAPAMVASLPPANAEAACNKGFFWPFARDPGDCLTDTEKKNGQIGVYRGAEASAANVAATQVSQPVPNAPAPAAPVVTVAPAAPAAAPAPAGEAACTKGFFWPFSRSPGDCLTDTEKKNGQTGTYGGGR